jgi:hypothetical protein
MNRITIFPWKISPAASRARCPSPNVRQLPLLDKKKGRPYTGKRYESQKRASYNGYYISLPS